MRQLIIAMIALGAAACATPRALPTGNPADFGFSKAALDRIEPALEAYVDSAKYAGIIAVIAKNGRIVYEEKVGWRDLDKRKRMRRDDVFRIYSMTKPVVAAGALKLVDQGKLSLDDPVAKFIPAFASIMVYDSGSAAAPFVSAPDSAMTIRHLLTHTAGLSYGITDHVPDSIFRAAAVYNPALTLAQFADSVAKLPLLFSPGTSYSYSSSLEIVGRVIEVASGQPLDRFLEEQLFQPLGMNDTEWRVTAGNRDRIATLYAPDRERGGVRAVTQDGLLRMFEPEARFLWASGGLLSTIDDYLRFAQMLLDGGSFDGRRVLSVQSVAELTRNQLPPALVELPNKTGMTDAGYGFGLAGSVLLDASKARLPGPNGIYRWSGYVGTYFWIDPANNLIGMVWSQLSPGRRYPLEYEFQRLVYEALR